MMRLIGITGGIATGKSTVTKQLRDLGLDAVCADELAREVVGPGSFGLRAIVQFFGKEVLDGGKLNRSKLREKIFSDPDKRLILERITHPLIQWRAQQEFQKLREKPLVFYDAALIFEKNLTKQFNAIIVVHTDRETQIKRLMARDSLNREVAERMIHSQLPLEEKMAAADLLVDNNRSVEDTRRQVAEVVRRLSSQSLV